MSREPGRIAAAAQHFVRDVHRRSSLSPWSRPFQLAAVSVVTLGTFLTVVLPGVTVSPNLAVALGQLMAEAWAAGMTAFGSATLVGMFWRGRLTTALALEQAGLIGWGGGLLVYAFALFGASQVTGTITAATALLAIALSAVFRAVQILGQQLHLRETERRLQGGSL